MSATAEGTVSTNTVKMFVNDISIASGDVIIFCDILNFDWFGIQHNLYDNSSQIRNVSLLSFVILLDFSG